MSRLSEQVRATKSRQYRMSKRAELVDQTRLRITEAAVAQHTTFGPANTSIASIAEAAGVTRLTVYRHFADLDSLFEACRGHWISQNPMPDVGSWAAIPDLGERARYALAQLYGWYRVHHEALFPIYRDMTAMPDSVQAAMRADDRALGQALVRGHAGSGRAGVTLRAAAGHLTDFWTWRSLAIQQGLDDKAAVDVAVTMLSAVQSGGRPER